MRKFYLLFWSVIYKPKHPWLRVLQPVIQLLKPDPIYKNLCGDGLGAYHSVA